MTARDNRVRIGVLSLHNSKETKAVLNAIADLGHEPVWLREENLQFKADGNQVQPTPDIDIVVNRLLLTKGERPLEDLELLRIYSEIRPVLNAPNAVLTATHKYATMAALTAADVSIPESIFALDQTALDETRHQMGDRVVQKAAIGAGGSKVWRIDETSTLVPPIDGRRTFIQEYIDCAARPWDVRVYVVDEAVIGAMKRHAASDEWRTNVARDGEVEGVSEPLPPTMKRIARQATAALGLDYAGVDLIEQDGTWSVLEVNATAGFKGLFEATDVNVAPYIAQLAIEQAGGRVSDEQVKKLVTTLDDSMPACKPSANDRSTEQITVGYTEEVTVSGTTDCTTAIGKADTGASRTNIDIGLADDIGAGPIQGKQQVKTGAQQTSTVRPLVDITVGIQGNWQTVTASIEDRDHMDYQILLGRDVLEQYHIDLQRRADEE